jgi:hypothetical protein
VSRFSKECSRPEEQSLCQKSFVPPKLVLFQIVAGIVRNSAYLMRISRLILKIERPKREAQQKWPVSGVATVLLLFQTISGDSPENRFHSRTVFITRHKRNRRAADNE